MDSLAFALQALQQIAALLEAGAEVKSLVDSTTASLKTMQAEDRDPNDAEWAALNQQVDALRASLHSH